MLIKIVALKGSLDKNPVTQGAVLLAKELLAGMLRLNDDAFNAYQASLKINPHHLNNIAGANDANK
jgi:hypothetical protein